MHYLENTATVYGPVSEMIEARELREEHIGRLVHFAYTEPTTMLDILVIGELREAHHAIAIDTHGTDHTVTVWVTGRQNMTGDKREFHLEHAAPIVFLQD